GRLGGTMTAVNMAPSTLFLEIRPDNGRPPGTMLYGHLATATTIQFVRQTNEAAPTPINIRWYVATFTSGVNVQRGLLDQTATPGCTPAPCMNVPITAVGAVNRSFVLWSKNSLDNHQNNIDNDDPLVGELTSTTNLQFRVDTDRPGMTIAWQVVEFTTAADINVQKGSTS